MVHILSRLAAHVDDIHRTTSGLGDAVLARRVYDDKWSLHELVCHIWRVQQVFDSRISRMLTEENPAVPSYNPEHDAEFAPLVAQPPLQTIDAFKQSRREFIGRLESLDAAQWNRPGQHPEYPRFTVAFQVEYMMHHEASHLYQMFARRQKLSLMADSL